MAKRLWTLFLIIGLLTPSLHQLYLNHKLISIEKVKDSAVRLLREDKKSGGSGMIYKSMKNKSWILTNAHVCEVVEKGGFAETYKGTYRVKRILKSKLHDLCLAEVHVDLKINNYTASEAPSMSSKVWVAGHPRLLPLIINEGYTSVRQEIQVVIGEEECTEEDLDNKDIAPYCFWRGSKPLIKNYDSLIISNYIQPGSSGSPVYNAEGHVVAVAFAARGELSQAWCVPWEYVVMFLEQEVADHKFTVIQ